VFFDRGTFWQADGAITFLLARDFIEVLNPRQYIRNVTKSR
jgi:hypothetical protein